MSLAILSVAIKFEHDVVAARQRSRQIAGLLGFEGQDQTRIATAVSEIARNVYQYAGGGRVEFMLEGTTAPQLLVIRIADSGRGIPDIAAVLDGQYKSATGMGLGIQGARRLMDRFRIESGERGTTVELQKLLPPRAPVFSTRNIHLITAELGRVKPQDAHQELQLQNQELLRTLDELRRRQDELIRLNRELEDTNRGVVALYAELDERADHLRHADELKSRFLSNMSHEFRTPLNSILALSKLLLDGTDGELNPEQIKQVSYIRHGAQDLSELVNDLLDLAKVEAGKTEVQPISFEAENLFGALRGMLRPLMVSQAVQLVFDDAIALGPLYTDESKVSQILRNFISNAIKFTEQGEIRITASSNPSTGEVTFAVRDTGIGIAPEDRGRIFQEFTQVDSPLQRKVRGTGLGLPLSKKLAELLGGHIELESEVGVGSSFKLHIPAKYQPPDQEAEDVIAVPEPDPNRIPVLVVDDSPEDRLLLESILRGTRYQCVLARSTWEARGLIASIRPRAIILDIMLRGETSWDLLVELKRDEHTTQIPVLVVSNVDDERKGLMLGADAYCLKPISRAVLLDRLDAMLAEGRVLVVDDNEVARYLIGKQLDRNRFVVMEAKNGAEALKYSAEFQPDVIILDLVMPGISGYEVLADLKNLPATAEIPVIIHSSIALDPDKYEQLSSNAVAIIAKNINPGLPLGRIIEQVLRERPAKERAIHNEAG